MSGKKQFWTWVAVLLGLHTLVLTASFFAPYDPAAHNRDLPFAPPTPIHFFDSEGNLRRPFIYPLAPRQGTFGVYEEDRSRPVPVQLLVRSDPHRLRLFGVEESARIFLLGSDDFGRDVFSRLLYGGRISLFSGLLAAALSLGLGLLLGSLAGFYGSRLDDLIMRGAELFLALPWLYLLFAARAFLPLHISPTQAFFLLVLVIGLTGWARPARLIRGVVLSARERNYVQAARGFGASDLYLLRRHVLPQTFGVLLTQAALLIPLFILAEVTLSFLGLGVGEPVPSWGNMLAGLQKYYVLASYPWMFAPALALIPVFLVYYKLADTLQERLQGAQA